MEEDMCIKYSKENLLENLPIRKSSQMEEWKMLYNLFFCVCLSPGMSVMEFSGNTNVNFYNRTHFIPFTKGKPSVFKLNYKDPLSLLPPSLPVSPLVLICSEAIVPPMQPLIRALRFHL